MYISRALMNAYMEGSHREMQWLYKLHLLTRVIRKNEGQIAEKKSIILNSRNNKNGLTYCTDRHETEPFNTSASGFRVADMLSSIDSIK